MGGFERCHTCLCRGSCAVTMARYRELSCLACNCPAFSRIHSALFHATSNFSSQWPQQHHVHQTLVSSSMATTFLPIIITTSINSGGQRIRTWPCHRAFPRQTRSAQTVEDTASRREGPDKGLRRRIRDIVVVATTPAHRTERKTPNGGPDQVHWQSGLFDDTPMLL